MIQKEQEVNCFFRLPPTESSCCADQVSQHVEEKVLALQISLRELQTGVEGLGPLQTGGQ